MSHWGENKGEPSACPSVVCVVYAIHNQMTTSSPFPPTATAVAVPFDLSQRRCEAALQRLKAIIFYSPPRPPSTSYPFSLYTFLIT